MTDASLFQILGFAYLAIGLGMLISPAYYQKLLNELIASRASLFLAGFIALIGGLLLLKAQNFSGSSWFLLITLIGWVAFIKGLVLLVLPVRMTDFYRQFLAKIEHLQVAALVIVGLGVLLALISFWV